MKKQMHLSAEIQNLVELACRSETTVLLMGATGTGKSTLASAIHQKSKRAHRAFVSVNLASLHEGTFESELFGHEKGAFTGADRKRIGRLEEADGGTVFLDEIGELSLRMQARLLEFLQSRTITPMGGNTHKRLDIRVIVATHRNLDQAVLDGSFREDLFHRLRVLMIEMPSLMERSADFDTIVHDLIQQLSLQAGKSIQLLSPEFADALEQYSWPGNIRELQNVLEFAVLSSQNGQIHFKNLPQWFVRVQKNEDQKSLRELLLETKVRMTMNYDESLRAFERVYFESALRRFGGRVNFTATKIGMNKTTFLRRLQLHRISSVGYRAEAT